MYIFLKSFLAFRGIVLYFVKPIYQFTPKAQRYDYLSFYFYDCFFRLYLLDLSKKSKSRFSGSNAETLERA